MAPTSLESAVHTHGLWRSLVSALVWGTRGREFESPQPDAVGNPYNTRVSCRSRRQQTWAPSRRPGAHAAVVVWRDRRSGCRVGADSRRPALPSPNLDPFHPATVRAPSGLLDWPSVRLVDEFGVQQAETAGLAVAAELDRAVDTNGARARFTSRRRVAIPGDPWGARSALGVVPRIGHAMSSMLSRSTDHATPTALGGPGSASAARSAASAFGSFADGRCRSWLARIFPTRRCGFTVAILHSRFVCRPCRPGRGTPRPSP